MTTSASPGPPGAVRDRCELCDLPLSAGRVEASFEGRTQVFCCHGCRQVYLILLEAAGTPDPEGFRRTDLYRRCRDAGLVPRSAEDLAASAAAAKAPPAQPAEASPANSQTLTATLKIANMWCPACAWLIETVVRQTPGVAAADCSFATDRLQIRFDPVATDPRRIIAAVERFGYAVATPGEAGEQTVQRVEWLRFGVSAFLSMNVMMLSFALYFGFFTDLAADSVASLSWPAAGMAAVVLGYGGYPLYRRAWHGLTQAAFSMETLVVIGALSAFGLSTANLISGSIHLYFDTACMLISLVLLGKMLERRARGRVLARLEGFLGLMPPKTRVVSEQYPQGRFVAADRLAPGDLFRIGSDERAAADGVVVSGSGTVDESSITGEPMPIVKKTGDAVRSGSRVHAGCLTVRAVKVGVESTLGQMVAVVERTLSGRPAGEVRVQKALQWFVPAILSLSAATGAWVWLSGLGRDAALLRAVTVLVISCPCALGIAIPLARTAGLGLAAGKGMLVRDYEAFDQAGRVTTVVLDKTGTVTRGVWQLLDILPFGSWDRGRVLGLAAGLEQASAHPIAAEILSAAHAQGVRPEKMSAVETHANGISGRWGQRDVKIGSTEYLAVEFSGQEERAGPMRRREEGRSCVYLAADGRPAAVFVFGDELRQGVEAALAALRGRGLRLVLVSGDGTETTRVVGRRLGIPESLGGCRPADKADFVARLQQQGEVVAMVGDGINDAPALAQSDLGLAVFAGGNLGKDVADVTLMRADSSQVPEFFEFAAGVHRKTRQNLILTFLYNAISIPVAMSGLLSPLVAVCAMLLSSLSVIGNTLRLTSPSSLDQNKTPHV